MCACGKGRRGILLPDDIAHGFHATQCTIYMGDRQHAVGGMYIVYVYTRTFHIEICYTAESSFLRYAEEINSKFNLKILKNRFLNWIAVLMFFFRMNVFYISV